MNNAQQLSVGTCRPSGDEFTEKWLNLQTSTRNEENNQVSFIDTTNYLSTRFIVVSYLTAE
ncbi:hypothetical protein AB4343_13315 [Vibrio breoganii]|uniref:hypothetical protein n=1 Tax=Vibrio breoganii TaxID=553239 RepID=UPI000C845219|nr:hypothetical protein [Vibrio breoganii]PMK68042.1 hypothetical protein BCT94_17200 [Vibrio breoganii]